MTLSFLKATRHESRFPLWGKNSDKIDLTDILIPDDNLITRISEKGGAIVTGEDTWNNDSLFEYIDTKNAPTIFDAMDFTPDFLICGDMGNEVADFFAVDRAKNRLCMIHAKTYKDDLDISATAFQDVCGQAVKNLGFLIPLNEFTLSQDLKKSWKADKKKGTLDRLRKTTGGKTVNEIFKEMRTMINNPTTKREVWVVMSKGFRIEEFNEERKKAKPKPSSIQVFYLLQSTWNAVSAIGASLKVICKP